METKIIVGENLKEKLLIGMTSEVSNPSLSVAIDIRFTDEEKMTNAKLALHSKKDLGVDSKKDILSFTGTIITEKESRPCIGYYLTDETIEVCRIMMI